MPKDQYEGSILDGRYQLERLLDSGSFGAVYEARDVKLGRIVAVKILFEKDETAFRKEAKLAVQFDHPNVVKVFDYGADGNLGVGYIVMEFLKGCRLDQLTTRHMARVPDAVIVRFVDQIGAALQMAHEKNLIHRDLKPQNVMLVDEGTLQERFVLLDLGLASQMNSTSTLRNQTLDGALSPRYASPEQMGQESVDFRSDIYSFGTILYELFTGEVPFVRDQLLSLMMAICSEPPPPFQMTAPKRDVPSEVEAIILHCLSKKAETRPESIRIVRSRILAAYGADTAMPALNTSGTKRSASRSAVAEPLQTGTMRPPSLDGDVQPEGSAPPNDADLFVGRGRKTRQRSGLWLGSVFFLLIVGTAVLLSTLFIPGRNSAPKVPEIPGGDMGLINVDSKISIEAGTASSLRIDVQPAGDVDGGGEPLVLSASDVPEWLTVKIPEIPTSSTRIELPVFAGDSFEAKSGEFILHASRGSRSREQKISVEVFAPKPWQLPAGFEPIPGVALVRAVDGLVYHPEIVRIIDSDLNVKFILVDPAKHTHTAYRELLPFYIMENKVWNSLFARYWDAEGNADQNSSPGAEWKQGATAGGQNLGTESHSYFPVVRVTAYNAHQFALWLGGDASCHLPSIKQWEMAAGLPIWQGMTPDEQAASNWPEGPFHGRWIPGETQVCVDRRQFGPQPVGESRDDISMTGCRDIAGNVEELTEEMLFGRRIGEVTPGSESNLLRVMTRGRSYINEKPLNWGDLLDPEGQSGAVGYDEFDPTIGFRVVLDTNR